MIIETRGLSKQYRSAVALDRLDLAVPEGRISAFLGPNGSGKTTTIRILLGLARPTAGEAFVFDKPATDESSSLEIRQRVGYVSEDKRLYPCMTGEQILDFTRPLFPGWSRELERRLVAAFSLPLDQKIKTFSKGMRSTLALILALARQPALLILDEPSVGLDPAAAEHMLQAIVETAARGCTVFFSSHQISEVERIADEVFIMCDGRLALHRPCPGRLMSQLPVGLEDHGDGFLEIRARFVEGRALRVGSGQLLDETDVPLGHLAKDGRELKVHDAMIRLGRHDAYRRFTPQSVRFAATAVAGISNLPVFSRIFRCPFLALC